MSTFIINGGKALKGIYPVSGAKNAAPKLLIASLLSRGRCLFHNIPKFSDTFRSIEALTSVGASVRFAGDHSVEVHCKHIHDCEIPLEAMRARQSVLFIGAMLARGGKVLIHPPKGDAIGRRPINRHLDGIKKLGGKIRMRGKMMEITMSARPRSMVYVFEKNTHCGTENLILASVFNRGIVTLKNAAQEPEVDNLIEVLNRMGARIRRTEARTLVIKGVKPFLKGATSASIPDRLESATAITISVLTGGNVKISHAPKHLIVPFVKFCEQTGIRLQWRDDVVSIKKIPRFLSPASLTTDWEPGFMTDWQPLATLMLAIRAKGRSIIHERIYETRWRYLDELKNMGVRFRKFQPPEFTPRDYNFNDEDYRDHEPHAAYVWGPTNIRPAVLRSHDVRAGIDMLIAALVAKGRSIIHDPQDHIDRGYENIVDKLSALGADITRV